MTLTDTKIHQYLTKAIAALLKGKKQEAIQHARSALNLLEQ